MASEHETHLLNIRRGGHSIQGEWRLAGDEVEVQCPYGADRARVDGAPPARVAELLIARLAFVAMGGHAEPLMH